MDTSENPDEIPVFDIGPCKVKSNNKIGRYVIASRPIKEGEIICHDYPLIISPKFVGLSRNKSYDNNNINNNSSNINNNSSNINSVYNNNNVQETCLTCFKKCSTICRFCSWPACDFICEKGYFHSQFECKVFRENNVRPGDYEFDFMALEVLRCLLLRDRDPKSWERFRRLEPNTDARLNDWKTEECRDYVIDFIRNKCRLMEETPENVEKALGAIYTNSFTLTMHYTRHMSAIFHLLSFFAHSCDANMDLIWGFHPSVYSNYDQSYFSIKFYAVRDIEIGESLTHCYYYPPKTLEDRQQFLDESYYFKCDCTKCRLDFFEEIQGKHYFDEDEEIDESENQNEIINSDEKFDEDN